MTVFEISPKSAASSRSFYITSLLQHPAGWIRAQYKSYYYCYIIDHHRGFETLGGEDRFKFLMDTPDEAIIICVAKYVFLFTVLKENQTV